MKELSRRFFLSLLALSLHCNRSNSPQRRCARCGMHIAERSHWQAGALSEDGNPLLFDAPICLLRYRIAHPRLRSPWITEYYGPAGVRTAPSEVRFIRGSDVVGPMGHDFVPVRLERVELFLREHHGAQAYTFDELASVLPPTP